MKVLVSIILLNYNKNQFTYDCLKSLNQQTYRNFEIIIVDNNSKLTVYLELKKIVEKFTDTLDIKLIRNKYNLYYAGGNNKGIKKSKGNFICLLNNDTEVPSTFLENVVNYMVLNKNVGMLCPKILFYEDKERIWYAGAYLNPRSIYFSYHIGLNQKNSSKFDDIAETAYANGAALFIRKNVIDSIGLLDEIFFMYSEETDWNYRVKREGFKIIYFPKTVVYHKVDLITKKNRYGFRENPFQIYLYTRNKIIFVIKNLILMNIISFFLVYQIRNSIIELGLSIAQKNSQFFIAHFRALWKGSVIGIRRRTNRKCGKIMRKEYKYLNTFKKRK